MPSYKIHSIKNNKKLSFIIEGDNEEIVKQNLSMDGFIVLTIEQVKDEKNKIPRFAFEGLKDNSSRIEGRVDALDIFSAYEILRDDYRYIILKLYPIDVTDPIEQERIFKNILQIYPTETTKKSKEPIKNKTLTELDILRKYLEILTKIISDGTLENKEILLYDIKRVQLINSISSIEEVIKKTIKTLYNKSGIQEKKQIYKTISPIVKHLSMFIFPPWVYSFIIETQNILSIMKMLFGAPEKAKGKNEEKKILLKSIKFLQKNNTPEKKIYTNKNIFLLMKKQYRSSWFDIFKFEGSYFYFYSLIRQNRILFWFKKIQEYIGMITLYTCFFLIMGIVIVGGLFSPQYLFFNGFMSLILGMVFISLVIFIKEI